MPQVARPWRRRLSGLAAAQKMASLRPIPLRLTQSTALEGHGRVLMILGFGAVGLKVAGRSTDSFESLTQGPTLGVAGCRAKSWLRLATASGSGSRHGISSPASTTSSATTRSLRLVSLLTCLRMSNACCWVQRWAAMTMPIAAPITRADLRLPPADVHAPLEARHRPAVLR